MGLFNFFKRTDGLEPSKDTNASWGKNAQANGPLKKHITSEPGAYHHDTLFIGPVWRIDLDREQVVSIVTKAYQRGRMDVRDRNDGVDRGNNLENVLKDTMKEIGAIDSE